MSDRDRDALKAHADRIIELEDEVEAGGVATLEADALAAHKAVLHQWVDELVGVVVSPGLGRVTLIHGGGRQSSIASPDLPIRMSAPVRR